ncbi:hypothetical protein GCM10011586_23630 [Silvibacterium dinghuense]|nr:hypothetical protein GCM10011586_23630 [Silvibacterium dinghuense]
MTAVTVNVFPEIEPVNTASAIIHPLVTRADGLLGIPSFPIIVMPSHIKHAPFSVNAGRRSITVVPIEGFQLIVLEISVYVLASPIKCGELKSTGVLSP